jgi:hypothetical protein
MTQPTDAPTAEVASDEVPKTYGSMDEIFNEILARSSLESFTDVVRTKRVVVTMPEGTPLAIDLGQASPFDKTSLVVGIFHDEDETRVYTFPKEKGEIKRYSIAKQFRFLAVDSMADVEQFIDEMADEYVILADEPPEDTPAPNGATVSSGG